ncbi:hypothetical protein, partial [Salinibacterium sp.]|uniref:hypothetical protein n=1 Tax=Salinibacterium sp. TaxID=1915057 RepID=UPI00286C617C
HRSDQAVAGQGAEELPASKLWSSVAVDHASGDLLHPPTLDLSADLIRGRRQRPQQRLLLALEHAEAGAGTFLERFPVVGIDAFGNRSRLLGTVDKTVFTADAPGVTSAGGVPR